MGNVLVGLADHVTAKTTDLGASKSGDIQYAASEMKGWRDTMEDCHTLCTEIPVDESSDGECLEDHSLFAVYDGHGGGFSSDYAGKALVRIFSERKAWKKYATLSQDKKRDVSGIELLRKALKGTFMALDDELRHQHIAQNETLLCKLSSNESEGDGVSETLQPFRVERSGTTIVVVLITPSHVICANAGDSRAILHKGTGVMPLSFDHKPNNVAELERIVSAGGFVKGRRVDGDLAVSRGLGDFVFKSEEGLAPHKQRVIAEPDFMVYPRDHEDDEFIVLACDGVWDVVTNFECSKMIQDIIEEGETDLGLICEEVLDSCLEKNSRDNMTIVTVALPAIKLCKDPLKSSNAVWTRRAARKARILELQARIVAQSAGEGLGLDLGLMEAPPSGTLPARSRQPTVPARC
jgi:serine/threonine protein phosphatase PrpC